MSPSLVHTQLKEHWQETGKGIARHQVVTTSCRELLVQPTPGATRLLYSGCRWPFLVVCSKIHTQNLTWNLHKRKAARVARNETLELRKTYHASLIGHGLFRRVCVGILPLLPRHPLPGSRLTNRQLNSPARLVNLKPDFEVRTTIYICNSLILQIPACCINIWNVCSA